MPLHEPITVTALVCAPIEDVWHFWNDPESIMVWSHASDDWHTPRATNTLDVGGKFVITMEAKDGSVSFDFEGTYTEIVEPERIAYTMDDERKVVVTFAVRDGGTLVTESFEPETENPVEVQRTGWQAILNNFKQYAESHT